MRLHACIFFLTFFSGLGIINAQRSKFEIGLDAGPSKASLKIQNAPRWALSPRLGYSAGFCFSYNFKKIISLKTGLYNELKGCTTTYTVVDERGNKVAAGKNNLGLKYLTVPLLVKLSFGKDLRLFVNGGAYVSCLLNSNVTERSNVQTNSPLRSAFVNTTDFGFCAGAGLTYSVHKKVLMSFEVRNSSGTKDIDTGNQTCYVRSVKTNAVNFIIGVAFKLGERISTGKKRNSSIK